MAWSIFGTTDEHISGPVGSLCSKSKKSIYSDGAWCGHCLNDNMRTWIDHDRKKCPTCHCDITEDKRIID